MTRLLVVDDSQRAALGLAMAGREHDRIDSVAIATPSELEQTPDETLAEFDRIIVDVWDDEAEQTETSTDVLSGIDIVRRVRSLAPNVTTVAIIPMFHDRPVLMRRVLDSGAHAVVHEVELSSTTALLHVTGDCGASCEDHHVTAQSGGDGPSPNDAVDVYRQSTLYGRINPGHTQASLGRRQAINLRDALIDAGIAAGETTGRPRWPEVVDQLLRLLGR